MPWPCLIQKKITWKLCVDILIISSSIMGGLSWGYLDTWMTGSYLISWITLFDPKANTLKLCINIFIRTVSRIGGSFTGVLGGHWGFLTENFDIRVILGLKDHIVWPKGRYLEGWYLSNWIRSDYMTSVEVRWHQIRYDTIRCHHMKTYEIRCDWMRSDDFRSDEIR